METVTICAQRGEQNRLRRQWKQSQFARSAEKMFAYGGRVQTNSRSYAQAAAPMSTCELLTTITIIIIARLTLPTCVWCFGSPVGFRISNKLFCWESVIAIRSQFHCVCRPSSCFVWPLVRKMTQIQNLIAKFGPYFRAMSCSPSVLRVEEVVRDENTYDI